MKKILLFLFSLFFSLGIQAIERKVKEAIPNPDLQKKVWDAMWITCPGVSLLNYGVYHFRKTFDLEAVPESFVVNVSADNRYRLYVNGESVCYGPARGDLMHWYYETVDIAPLLKSGKNVISALVWNAANYKPGAQISLNTGFILQGNTEKEFIVNTNDSWKVINDKAYSPSPDNRQDTGCADRIDGSIYPWGWETMNYDDGNWLKAIMISRALPYGLGTGYNWVLCPRDIPLMEDKPLRMKTIRRTNGIQVTDTFLQGKTSVTIPANKKVSFLIDQTFLTNAYPMLTVSGGKGSEILIRYAEAMKKDGQKANRNDVNGREITGWVDKFYPDGGSNRLFSSLWFRTYRYVEVDITTKEEALNLLDFYGMYTAYPFKENGSFVSDEADLSKIWEVGWRTARLCANETYFDCPYYEQLMYVGDTRIQALISLYVSGDDRLMRKAIKMFDYSRTYEGITASRYPSHVAQYIPPFSLYWINMVHDYWMYRDDPIFVKSCLPGVLSVLEWFRDKIDARTGVLGYLPHWNFIDWPKEWPWDNNLPLGGTHRATIDGGSAIISLQYAYAIKDAIDLLNAFGETYLAERYKQLGASISNHIWNDCWNESKQLLADDLQGSSYSQHVNIMGILSDAVPQNKQVEVFNHLDTDPSLIQATFYYRFYLFKALKKVGLAEHYVSMLQPWKDMINIGLTTFAENPEPTRSDCHAWSASPCIDFLATICGVEPAEPGFKSVKVEPHLGTLKRIKGNVPHPKGLINVVLEQKGDNLKGEIILPAGLSGTFNWFGNKKALCEGINNINVSKK